MKGNQRTVCKRKANELRIQKYVRRAAEVKHDCLLRKRMSKPEEQCSIEPKLHFCVCQITEMESKSRLYFISVRFKQLCSTNSVGEQALSTWSLDLYWPACPLTLLVPRNPTIKLLQAKFSLNVSPFVCCKRNYTKHRSNFTCRGVCWGLRHYVAQALSSWIFVQVLSERCSCSAAYSRNTLQIDSKGRFQPVVLQLLWGKACAEPPWPGGRQQQASQSSPL